MWIDPAVSLLIAAIILIGSWHLLRSAFLLALDAVPPGVDLAAIRDHLSEEPGVREIHDLHIWALSTTDVALTVHLVCSDLEEAQSLLITVPPQLRDIFNIGHTTIQIETLDTARQCMLRPAARI